MGCSIHDRNQTCRGHGRGERPLSPSPSAKKLHGSGHEVHLLQCAMAKLWIFVSSTAQAKPLLTFVPSYLGSQPPQANAVVPRKNKETTTNAPHRNQRWTEIHLRGWNAKRRMRTCPRRNSVNKTNATPPKPTTHRTRSLYSVPFSVVSNINKYCPRSKRLLSPSS